MAGSRAKRSLRRVLVALAIFLAVEYLVLPQLAGARRALDLLGRVETRWLVAGVVLELLAVLAYAQLTRTLVPAPSRPGMVTTSRITLTTLGLSHVVPGGSAVGTSVGFRLLTSTGVPAGDAVFAIATQALGSAVVLNLILWVGLVVSIPARGFDPLYGTAAVLGGLLLGAVAVAVALATRGEERMVDLVCRGAGRVPFLDGESLAGGLRRVAGRLRSLAGDPRLVARAAGWAAANWLLDAASLGMFVAAFGGHPPLDGLVISFGLANVLAAVPITPGGLGIVEATLTAGLVGFGVPSGEALLGVVSYRLVNFWLPIPLGAAAYLSLKIGDAAERRRARDELERVASDTLEEVPTAREWAGQRGFGHQ
jgi:uncharacterized protein (TIRG00374 family)